MGLLNTLDRFFPDEQIMGLLGNRSGQPAPAAPPPQPVSPTPAAPQAKGPGFWRVLDEVLGGKTITEANDDYAAMQRKNQLMDQFGGLFSPGGATGGGATGGGAVPVNVATNGSVAGMGGQPRAPVAPQGSPLTINDPRLAQAAFLAPQIDKGLSNGVSGVLDVLKAQQPEYGYDRGYSYVRKGVGSDQNPAYHTELDKGMQPDAAGVVQNAPGYVKSAAEAAGAVSGAQEQAKAHEDLVDYVINGVPYKLPRDVATALSRAQFSGAPAAAGGGQPGPQGGAQPVTAGGFGRGLSPGQEEAQKTDYKAGADLIGGAQDARNTAITNARNASMAFDGILKLDPNQFTPFVAGAKKLMLSLHPENPQLADYVNNAEGYRMLVTRMVLPQAKALGSNPSNRDAKIIADSMPGLSTPRAAGAVYFAMEAANANKEAQRQEFFQNWTGEQRKSEMQQAWAKSDAAKRSIFQDPVFERLQLSGKPAVVYKQGKDGKRYGIFMPYTQTGAVNPSAQVFEAY